MLDKDIKEAIEKILVQFQPVFTAHKGGAELVSANSETVVLRLKGHCEDCALAPLTFGLGIERLIREKIPSIKEVRYTN